MILEGAMLQVKEGMEHDFELTFQEASKIIASMEGYIEHSIHRCFEVEGKYLLLVKWERLEDHTIGFRQSEQYEKWKTMLHHYYEPFPIVEHFQKIEL
ncbi:antibiotic biosynthesis monooxygenase [Staphylococcus succinus]|uniref:Signal transduction protein TRAP n=1 Tax=Staphylococcus succinus TaxID=61015 RepID=A0A9Q6MW01_9STAP|nr:antibiotic biosynthesis monooxygenase [Staphylococcus succinus]MEB7462880.1 antibiotic biosynthesis monooxygenase [Staphylococcus succinus]MEB8127511.1 antibiotic biosynthesis monooxygenase [Staphylococcus succinus]MEB8210341.1 antibiotic biosynthesis monooxygenase [Staphylococcus succinus]PKI21363.1 antibiotic biosynthesis monooxygenase [Staphylococcus succinus]PTI41972.1 antibiotic biosynthesis monooxygenase [Staphylococcus succinus]